MSTAPGAGSRREDLPWLRRRGRLPAVAEPESAPSPPAAQPPPPPARPQPAVDWARARPGETVILGRQQPTVRLTRIQSGVGALSIRAALPGDTGGVLLGCAYQLRSGQSALLPGPVGPSLAPPGSRRPVILADHLTLTLDLLQSRGIQRLVVFTYSPAGTSVSWGGTLVVRTLGGARIEVPLGRPESPGALVALSLYNIDGEFVLRAEDELVAGAARQVCAAYGFEQISWLDDQTPLR